MTLGPADTHTPPTPTGGDTVDGAERVWGIVAEVLAGAGCGVVTGLPADEPGLLEAAARVGGLDVVPVRDQRVAACAAIGHAAVSGRPAVVAVNSGPGFANALTGLLEAASLGSPVVVVTTRIPLERLGRGGFQEVDQRGMAGPITMWSCTVERGDRLVWALRRAVHLAIAGRGGVTLVEITDEVLREPVEDPPPAVPLPNPRSVAAPPDVERAARLLRDATCPVLVAGGGARRSQAGPAVVALAERLGAPVLTTASGRGTIDERDWPALGLVGLYADPLVRPLLARADVVVAIGSRLEETATMGWELPRLVQIDRDPAACLEHLEPEVFLLGDAALTVSALTAALGDHQPRSRARVEAVKEQLTAPAPAGPTPQAIGAAVTAFGDDAVLVQENGLHDLWGYHYPAVTIGPGHTVVAPGEQTMVGFGLGAALGAAIAVPTRPILLVCGDGAAEMSVAALPTIAERRLGVTVLMLDNRGFGWPRLMRGGGGITDFPAQSHVPHVVRALGGATFQPATITELKSALEAARAANRTGRMALISLKVADEPLPPAALTALGGDHA